MNKTTNSIKLLRSVMLLLVTMLTLSAQTAQADVILKVYTDGLESSDGGTIVLDGTSYVIVTPYANYYIDKVVHTYDTGGGVITQTLNPTGMGNYYFNSSSGGTVSAYFATNNFTVSFNSNGGTGTMANVISTSSITIPPCGFTKDNSFFIGWATTSDGNVQYQPGQTITLTGNLTLYAKWDLLLYTVSLYANDGTSTVTDVPAGSSYTIPACGFSRNGYSFIGWSTLAEGEIVYNPATTISLSGDLSLYAKWKINRTVSFNSNGGAGTMESVTQMDGTNYTFSTCGYAKDGYIFIGWATSADGPVEYNSGSNITLTGDLVLYAKWADTSENYIVLFNANDGTGTMEPVQQAKNSSYTIPACDFTRQNKFFFGWATSTDGPLEYNPGDVITLSDNLTLYAIWKGSGYQFVEGNYKYTISGVNPNTAKLHKYNGDKPTGELYIPATVTCAGINFTVTSIGASSFKDCNGLTTVTIPDGVTSIEHYAFSGCTALTSVNMPDGVTIIEHYAFEKCSALTTINIPSCLTIISSHVFYNCNSLTALTLPSGVTSIGYSAFDGCTNLSVNIPSGLTSIGKEAFRSCDAVTSVTIPSGVTSIGESSFSHCDNLREVTLFATSLTEYGVDAFNNNYNLRKIYVPAASVDTYKSAWSSYAGDIEPLDVIIDDGDNRSVLTAVNEQTKNIALKRSFPKGKKQTVCLPFEPTELLNFGKVWAFTGISEGKAVMTQITSGTLSANTPYIFEASNDMWSITFPNVQVSIGADPQTAGSGFTFHGTYEQKVWEASSDEVQNGTIYGFMMSDNDGQAAGQFVKARRRTVLRPFSCWLEFNGELSGTQTSQAPLRSATGSGTSSSASELPDVIEILWVGADGTTETTGVIDTRTGTLNDDDAWYDLFGRKLNGEPTKPGLYINNGKKVHM